MSQRQWVNFTETNNSALSSGPNDPILQSQPAQCKTDPASPSLIQWSEFSDTNKQASSQINVHWVKWLNQSPESTLLSQLQCVKQTSCIKWSEQSLLSQITKSYPLGQPKSDESIGSSPLHSIYFDSNPPWRVNQLRWANYNVRTESQTPLHWDKQAND